MLRISITFHKKKIKNEIFSKFYTYLKSGLILFILYFAIIDMDKKFKFILQ